MAEANKVGSVYIFVNSSMPEVVKIGITEGEPEDRAKSLSSPTGVPTPFIVVWKELVENPAKVEAIIHAKLQKKRVSNKREFFKISTPEAIKIVQEICDKTEFKVNASSSSSTKKRMGEREISDKQKRERQRREQRRREK